MEPLTAPPTPPSKVSNLVLVQGMAQTRETLAEWRAAPWPVLAAWFSASFGIALGLLAGILVVSHNTTPDPMSGVLPGIYEQIGLPEVGRTIGRNLLVLALHSLACVAGFIAGSSMPLEAQERGGAWGVIHDYAGRFAILFVTAATAFSLVTQGYVLGGLTGDMSTQLDLTQLELIILLLPHAIPELVGLFLPLAAWLLASRRGQWHQLLAATFVTTAIALPLVFAAALIEVYVTPDLIAHYAGLR